MIGRGKFHKGIPVDPILDGCGKGLSRFESHARRRAGRKKCAGPWIFHTLSGLLFAAQLAANALWSWLFFGWHLGAAAAVEVLILLALIVATVIAFFRTSRVAGLLILPYLAWVGFASLLTWAVWRSNPGLL